MRGIIVTLFLLGALVTLSAQPIFYLSADGEDTADGESPATPWRTLQKLQRELPRLQPGSQVLFRRGDTYPGGLTVSTGGTAEQPITFGAYGEGENPVLTGAVPVREWVAWRDGIFVAAVPQPVGWLYAGDRFLTPARYPNSGFLRFPESSSGKFTNVFKDASGRPAGYWVGSTAHLRGHRFVYQEKQVMAHHDSTVILWGNVYSPIRGFGYFFDRKLAELDTISEWHYDELSDLLYYYPADERELAQTLAVVHPTALWLEKDYVTIKDIDFQHYGQYGIKGDYRSGVTVTGCSFRYINDRAIDVSRGAGWSIRDNSFADILNTAIRTGDCRDFRVADNTIRRIALQQGLFRFPFGSAIYVGGRASKNNYFGHNVIDSIGRQGFYVNGTGHLIERNRITNTILYSDDDGAINLYGGGNVVARDITIRDNYIENTFGELESVDTWYTWQKNTMDVGIYIDDLSEDIAISGNTIINNTTGILLHNCRRVDVIDNVIFRPRGTGIEIRNDWIIDDWEFVRDIRLEDNIVFVEEAEAHPLQLFDEKSNWPRFATYRDNLLVHPNGSTAILKEWVDNDYLTYKGQDRPLTVDELNELTAQRDAAARGVSGTPDWLRDRPHFTARLIRNPTDDPLEKNLPEKTGRTYYDLSGRKIDSVSLQPWRSVIVLRADSKPDR